MRSLQRGAFRMNPIVMVGMLGLITIGVVILMIGKSPEEAAREFMAALSKGDVTTLTRLSYMPDPEQPVEQQWRETFDEKAKNYVFAWQLQGSEKVSENDAVVKVMIVEYRGPELHENDITNLPLTKRDGEWKVDLRSLSRSFFPGLPR
ncbi:MAG: hypothetical protein ABIV13_05095 [Fimbriimonadales bacterium]